MPYALRAFGAPVWYNNTNTYTVLIGSQQAFIIAGSLQVDNTIGRRGQAQFTVRTKTATHFQQYQQMSILDQTGMLVFSGYITSPKEQKPGFQNSLLHTITCCDQHYLADKRRIAAVYTNKTCGYIVQDILNNTLAGEGVTVGQIYDGQTPSPTLYPSNTLYPGGNVGIIPSATFVYAKVSDALDELAKQASTAGVPYYWMIDQYKRLWFVPYTAVVNTTVVDGTQIEQMNNPATVTWANPTYRNTQYVVGGVQQTVQQTEKRVGDGNTTAWTMSFDLAQVPTITVDGVAKSVGIKGITTGKNFYWQQGSSIITQDSSGTKLTSANTLQVVYIGQYPATVVANNAAQVSYQAAIDGTSGIVEDVQTDKTLASINNGLNEAGQLLTRYAVQGAQLQFTTLKAGFAPGQLITANLPMHSLYNAQMLIEQVTAADSDGLNIWYTVTAVLGPYDITWVDFFSKVLTQQTPANSINVGVSQAIVLLQSFQAKLSYTAGFTATVYACPLPNTTQYPNTTLYPC